MSIIHNYCITNKNYLFLNNLKLNIIIAGAHNKELKLYPPNWLRDNNGINISKKNKNFGTLTSHYWFWQNRLKYHNTKDWIGICHYRRFFLKKKVIKMK